MEKLVADFGRLGYLEHLLELDASNWLMNNGYEYVTGSHEFNFIPIDDNNYSLAIESSYSKAIDFKKYMKNSCGIKKRSKLREKSRAYSYGHTYYNRYLEYYNFTDEDLDILITYLRIKLNSSIDKDISNIITMRKLSCTRLNTLVCSILHKKGNKISPNSIIIDGIVNHNNEVELFINCHNKEIEKKFFRLLDLPPSYVWRYETKTKGYYNFCITLNPLEYISLFKQLLYKDWGIL